MENILEEGSPVMSATSNRQAPPPPAYPNHTPGGWAPRGGNAMTTPVTAEGSRRRLGVRVDARRLWSGGAASAVVAGLVALAGVLVSRWIFAVPVLAPHQDGAYGDVHTTALVLASAVAALVATGLVHLLMVSTPRPMMYFGWIVALVTTIVVIYPFSTSAPLYAKVATAAVNLAIGMAIAMLVGGAAARSTVKATLPPAPYDLPEAYDRPYEQAPSYNRPFDQAQFYVRPYADDLGQPGADYR
jgi:uncharacterized protein DUF6069